MVALEIEKAREIGMIEAEAGRRRYHRLAVIGHAQPRGLDHGNVIGPVADRGGVGGRDGEVGRQALEGGALGEAVQDRLDDLAGKRSLGR